ncbi:MAG: hypothetical protein P8020_15710 [Acidobacteriota bacterium]
MIDHILKTVSEGSDTTSQRYRWGGGRSSDPRDLAETVCARRIYFTRE